MDQENSEKQSAPQKIPPWFVFKVGEEVPMKGWRFKISGYTKDGKIVFECAGQTGKAIKKGKR